MKKFLIILSICSLLILDIFIIWLAINDHYRDAPSGAVTATDEQPEPSVASDDSTDIKVLTTADSVEEAPDEIVTTVDEEPDLSIASYEAVDTRVSAVADSVEDVTGDAVTAVEKEPDPAVVSDDAVDTTVLSSADSFADALGEVVTAATNNTEAVVAPESHVGTNVLASTGSYVDVLNEAVTAATKNTEAVVVPDSNAGTNTLADSGSYVNVLSSEVSGIKMESNAVVTSTDETPEPSVVPDDSVDTSAIANKVVNELEKILTGVSSGEVKQEDLAGIVSTAVKEGSEIDEIQRAVNDAMAELRDKEGLDIQSETLEFAAKSINEIVGASRDIAQGDPSDPYIQSLNAEVDETSLKRSEGGDKQPTSTRTMIKAAQAGFEPNTETEKPKSDRTDTAKAQGARIRTIVVLKGESLSVIAAKIYGSGRKYPLLYKANRDLLNNPNHIEIGQILRVPPLSSK